MAEQHGNYIFDPSLKYFLDQLEQAFKDAIKITANEAYNTVMAAWDAEQGYTESGNLINWEKTNEANPILRDTGNLQRSLETIFIEDDFDFKFEVNNTDTFPYRQSENPGIYGGTGEPRHAKNISLWNNDLRPHTGVPSEYQPEGSVRLEIAIKKCRDVVRELKASGNIRRVG
tara:strand:+ start:479 stop:997 length:519 start_codon:yes stop_codon:yes gene_type:complete